MARLTYCPGSYLMELHTPQAESGEQDEDEARQQGTDVHEALHSGDDEDLDEEGKKIAERLKRMEREAIDTFLDDTGAKESELEIIRERRYWVANKRGTSLYSGQPDLVVIAPGGWAMVMDYKTGFKEVDHASMNAQIRSLVVAVWKNHPKLRNIRGYIAAYRFRESLSRVDYDAGLLLKAEREIDFVLWRAWRPDAERVPGEWCRYCKAKAFCREAAAMSLLPVVHVPEKKRQAKKEELNVIALGLSVEEVVAVWKWRTLIEHVLKAVTNRLRNLPPEVLASHGLKVVPGGEVTKITQVPELKHKLEIDDLMTPEEWVACCTPVLGRINELIVPRLMHQQGLPTKEAGESAADRYIEAFAQKVQRAPSIRKMNQHEIKEWKESHEPQDR